MGTSFSLYTAKIKTLYLVFNCSAEDLCKLISDRFRVVCKVDGNLQLDSRDWSMYSSSLKLVQLTEDPFPQKNCLICGFPVSGIRRHADKFRQQCQIENSRHTVTKRERIGKSFNPFQRSQKQGGACWNQALHKRDSWWKRMLI